ncbi:MAG TPA: T9SS type A sorting domain-containing protein [Bacteroidia bacterium]|nr:T9SS type A sorting domain-containing protein [Bacteroidia bacterium]
MKKTLLFCSLIASVFSVQAQPWTNAVIDINQVETRINSNGDLFWDYTSGLYEVPNDSGANTMFAGASWIGGLDAGGQLHLGAQTYRQSGSDFYPGPVMNTANYSAANDLLWNKVWKINKTTIDSFLTWCSWPWMYPGYTIPSAITSWPAHGDVNQGQALQLAPFVDRDGDGMYNPVAGDYPCIKGDQALFVIFNDDRNIHTETGGTKLGLEIHAMMYAYSAPGTWLDSTVFINYQLFNRSSVSYHDMYWGQWTDFDLGSPFDDYVGCDVTRSIGYAYNGGLYDGGNASPGPGHYGANPPAQGVAILRGPEATPLDGIDNDRDGVIDEADETWAMGHFVFYNNNFTTTGNPVTAQDHYDYLSGYWLDGSPFTYGGNGYGGSTPAAFMFPGTSDPLGWGTNMVPQIPWDEASSGNTPNDRRALTSAGPFQFDAGKQMCIAVAYVFGRGTSGPASGVRAMQNATDSANVFYAQNNPCTCDENTVGIQSHSSETIGLYPNPANESINIICGDNSTGSTVEIIDVNGKVVKTAMVLSGNSVIVNTSNLAAGVYFVRVNKGSVVLMSKFVRN